jgi:hypothetical protein
MIYRRPDSLAVVWFGSSTPHPSLVSSCLSFSVLLCVAGRELITRDGWGEGLGKGVGEEPNHTTAKKVWSSIEIIQFSGEGLDKQVHLTMNVYYKYCSCSIWTLQLICNSNSRHNMLLLYPLYEIFSNNSWICHNFSLHGDRYWIKVSIRDITSGIMKFKYYYIWYEMRSVLHLTKRPNNNFDVYFKCDCY